MSDEAPDAAKDGPSLYRFWHERLDWIIGDFDTAVGDSEQKLVSALLLKACVRFLFGGQEDNSAAIFGGDADMIATGLVMATTEMLETKKFVMIEPLAIEAGLNYMQHAHRLLKYFADMLFDERNDIFLNPQIKGKLFEFVVAVRFMQGWWRDPGMQEFLPDWLRNMGIPIPTLLNNERSNIISSDTGRSVHPYLLEHLQNSKCDYALLPRKHFGPDLIYRNFLSCVKTTWTSQEISSTESDSNARTCLPQYWYDHGQTRHMQQLTALTISQHSRRFYYVRIEVPLSPSKHKAPPHQFHQYDTNGMCIDLNYESEAVAFFSQQFVDVYKDYLRRKGHGL